MSRSKCENMLTSSSKRDTVNLILKHDKQKHTEEPDEKPHGATECFAKQII